MTENEGMKMKDWECISPQKNISIQGVEGYETYRIDDSTIGVRAKWISVKDKLPPVKWSEPDEKGKRYSSDIPVLILREITCPSGKKFNSIVVGEYDTGGVPDRWIIGYYTVTEEYGLEFESVEIDDVTHWMPLPELPK